MYCPVSKELLSLLINLTNYTYMVPNMNTNVIPNFIVSDAVLAYDSAVKEIENLLVEVAKDLYLSGWSYLTSSEAPESYKELKQTTHDKCIIIADYGCENTIYSDPIYNHLFRFWHDVLHLVHDCNFSKEGESKVASYHLKMAETRGLSPLALRILNAETNGQVAYYFARKAFVVNQEAFIKSCLQHGINKAIRVEH